MDTKGSYRSSYRKNYSNRTGTIHSKHQNKKSFKEVLIGQFIVMGAILAVVLFLNVINIPITNNLTESIKSVITKNTDINDLSDTLSQSTENSPISTFKDSFQTIFGSTVNSDLTDEVNVINEENNVVKENNISQDTLIDINEGTSNVEEIGDFRIDQDLLNKMNTKFEDENSKK